MQPHAPAAPHPMQPSDAPPPQPTAPRPQFSILRLSFILSLTAALFLSGRWLLRDHWRKSGQVVLGKITSGRAIVLAFRCANTD